MCCKEDLRGILVRVLLRGGMAQNQAEVALPSGLMENRKVS